MESGQDYAQGVALYETHGKSRVVLNALQYGATDFTRQKLKKELQKLLEQENVRVVDTSVKRVPETPKRVPILTKGAERNPQESPQKVAVGAAKAGVVTKGAERSTQEPTPELKAQRRAWFAERNHLHPQLELVATNAERLAMSLRILELSDLISQSYEAQPDPDTTQTPSGHLSDITDTGEMRRLLANLRPQRTKLKKRPDRATDLAQVESDIKLLEERLKRDGGEPKLQ
jgi:hypothetical protein